VLACLIVHCFAFGTGAGLIGGWEWAPLGLAAGAAVAAWDLVQERRAEQALATARALRAGG
jgi:hypothetical protein